MGSGLCSVHKLTRFHQADSQLEIEPDLLQCPISFATFEDMPSAAKIPQKLFKRLIVFGYFAQEDE